MESFPFIWTASLSMEDRESLKIGVETMIAMAMRAQASEKENSCTEIKLMLPLESSLLKSTLYQLSTTSLSREALFQLLSTDPGLKSASPSRFRLSQSSMDPEFKPASLSRFRLSQSNLNLNKYHSKVLSLFRTFKWWAILNSHLKPSPTITKFQFRLRDLLTKIE